MKDRAAVTAALSSAALACCRPPTRVPPEAPVPPLAAVRYTASRPAPPAVVLAMARSSVALDVVTARTGSIAAPASWADVNAWSRATSRTTTASGIRNAIATIDVTAADTSASVVRTDLLMVPGSSSWWRPQRGGSSITPTPVSYTHLRAHETRHDLVCRLL